MNVLLLITIVSCFICIFGVLYFYKIGSIRRDDAIMFSAMSFIPIVNFVTAIVLTVYFFGYW